jgi:hypothetical protein
VVSVAYNFQTGRIKLKLHTEYGNVTQKVLLPVESVVQTAKAKARLIDFVGFEKTLPGFDQRLPAKCSVVPLLFDTEHYQSLEIN